MIGSYHGRHGGNPFVYAGVLIRRSALGYGADCGSLLHSQVGKCQVMAFMAAARTQLKEKFDLRHFHDYLWLNGNVPISLLQEEYLSEASHSSS